MASLKNLMKFKASITNAAVQGQVEGRVWRQSGGLRPLESPPSPCLKEAVPCGSGLKWPNHVIFLREAKNLDLYMKFPDLLNQTLWGANDMCLPDDLSREPPVCDLCLFA